MILIVTREDHDYTVRRFLGAAGRCLRFVRPITYERLLRARHAPLGHYIFTDFDRLTGEEVDTLIRLTDAIRATDPELRILNDPRHVLERYPLLHMLRREGFNDFGVTRLDTGDVPEQFPVFIRSEDGCAGPDTGLIHDEAAFREALRELQRRGLSLKRRIAVGFCAEPDDEGYFRKYGALNIGGEIIPQHIQRSQDWNVKWGASSFDEAAAAAELAYLQENPHREQLQNIFWKAGIDYGRIDYGIVDGKLQTYEINTNPALPRFANRTGLRSGRRGILRPLMISAFQALDSSSSRGPSSVKLPRWRLPKGPALRRSAADRILRRLRDRWA